MSSLGIDWAVAVIMIPLLGAIACFVGQRYAHVTGMIATAVSALAAIMLALHVAQGVPYRQEVGGWQAPLGIALEADGLSALLIAMTGIVGFAIALQAIRTLRTARPAAAQARAAPWAFWPLWLLLLSGMNALYLSADQFNLYVTLEIVSLAAVGLTAVSGKAEAFAAAMRYLFVGLFASLLYLLGVALLYAGYGVLDIASARNALRPEPLAELAMTLMFAGLALKTALFPLHFWLPPAHSNAAAPVSAILSALVVKTSFYLIMRLWFDMFAPAGIATSSVAMMLGILGAGAIIWGSVQAILAERLKLLVAYSTVAQIGYLFLLFPIADAADGVALQGVVYLMLAHAFAKAALFLCCELVQNRLGHDRVRALTSSTGLPRSIQLAFALAAVSLIGLPPSGGFVGKWLLLVSSLNNGFTGFTAIILIGTLLSAAAMMRVLVRFFAPPKDQTSIQTSGTISARALDLVPLLLAIMAILLGFAAPLLLPLLDIGGFAS
ncbi:MAG: complex I subunit 5 family protein [Sphingorhabdus sp.]